MHDECSKHGPITSLYIPRPHCSAAAADFEVEPGVGSVFVEFATVSAAQAADAAIKGRKYQKRTILTAFLPVHDYAERNFVD